MGTLIKRSIPVVLCLFFTLQMGIGQDLLDYNTYLTDLENSGQGQKADKIRGQYNGLFSCVYVSQSGDELKGESAPITAFSTCTVINTNLNQSQDYDEVKILVITIHDPNEVQVIRDDIINFFPKLQYIIYSSDNQDATNALSNMTQNSHVINLVITNPPS